MLFILAITTLKKKQTNKQKQKQKQKREENDLLQCFDKTENDVLLNVVTLRNTSYFPRSAASTSISACTKTEKKNGALITTHSFDLKKNINL